MVIFIILLHQTEHYKMVQIQNLQPLDTQILTEVTRGQRIQSSNAKVLLQRNFFSSVNKPSVEMLNKDK